MTRVRYYLGTVSRHAQPGTPIEGDGTTRAPGRLAGLLADDVRLDDGTLVTSTPSTATNCAASRRTSHDN